MTFLSDADLDILKRHHPDVADTRCPTCHGKDHFHFTYKGQRHVCDCPAQRRLYVRYLHAGIGLLYQRLTWDDYVGAEEPLEAVHDYLHHSESYINHGMGLYLCGPMGTGKTLLATLVLKDLVKRGYNCYSTTFANTVEAFTATWGDNDEKKRFADRFMYSDVLLLDDLGQEARTANRLPQTTFDRILRTRVQDGRPTILTTNMQAIEVKVGYGAPVLSLLTQQSIEIQTSGSDFRPTAHERTVAEVKAGETRPIV